MKQSNNHPRAIDPELRNARQAQRAIENGCADALGEPNADEIRPVVRQILDFLGFDTYTVQGVRELAPCNTEILINHLVGEVLANVENI